MRLSEYFEKANGMGILATTNLGRQVNQAIYTKPLFLTQDDDTCSFVMAKRLTHDNVEHSPCASYMFVEKGEGYVGKRLSLMVIEEETDPEKIKTIRRRYTIPEVSEAEGKFLVHFHIEGVRPLIGTE